MKVDLVSTGGKAALFINSIKQNIFNCIWLENWEAGEGIPSSLDIKDYSYLDGDVYAKTQCSQVISSNYFMFE